MPESIVRSFTTLYPNPRGLVYVKPYLWCAFGDNNRLVQMDLNGVVVRDIATPGSDPRGLGFDGKHFWHADATARVIYKLNIWGVVVDSFRAHVGSTRAVAWDGKNLWVAETGGRAEAHVFDSELNLLRVEYLENTDVGGIAFVGNFMYYSDRTTTKIFKRFRNGINIENYGTTATKPNGLATDGDFLYLSAGDATLIYVLNL